MNNNFTEKFVESILAADTSARLVSGNREILKRCHICMDSSNMKSAHMYIKVPINGEIPLYNCFKCGASGIVNSRFLRDLNIYDVEVLGDLVSYTKELSKTRNFKNLDDEEVIYTLYNNYITQCQLSELKLDYINKRLGLQLSYEDLLEDKIILNIYDLLNSNRVNTYTRDPYIVNQLNECFIGFLSADNAFINMRNLTPGRVAKSIDKRYINYNIFGKLSNTQGYYIIPSNIDITRPDPIKIHIAEGPFDILSILYNVNDNIRSHSLYAAIGGKGYYNIIKYFIEFKGLLNIELHIYPDNDIENYIINNIVNYLYPFGINIFIHRNLYEGEKDFGVPKNRIKESIYRI